MELINVPNIVTADEIRLPAFAPIPCTKLEIKSTPACTKTGNMVANVLANLAIKSAPEAINAGNWLVMPVTKFWMI